MLPDRRVEHIPQTIDVIAASGPLIAFESSKKLDTLISGSDGVPCTLRSEPKAANDSAGLLIRPAIMRERLSQAWLTERGETVHTSLTLAFCCR
jgi:hypothetical protein